MRQASLRHAQLDGAQHRCLIIALAQAFPIKNCFASSADCQSSAWKKATGGASGEIIIAMDQVWSGSLSYQNCPAGWTQIKRWDYADESGNANWRTSRTLCQCVSGCPAQTITLDQVYTQSSGVGYQTCPAGWDLLASMPFASIPYNQNDAISRIVCGK